MNKYNVRRRTKSVSDIYLSSASNGFVKGRPMPEGSDAFQRALTDLYNDDMCIKETEEEYLEQSDEEEEVFENDSNYSKTKQPPSSTAIFPKAGHVRNRQTSSSSSDSKVSFKKETSPSGKEKMNNSSKFFAQNGRWPEDQGAQLVRRHSINTVAFGTALDRNVVFRQ